MVAVRLDACTGDAKANTRIVSAAAGASSFLLLIFAFMVSEVAAEGYKGPRETRARPGGTLRNSL